MAEALRVRRVLTDTPLARRHDKALTGRVSHKIPTIPWADFERGRYPEEALSLAARAQTKLALGEYGAVDLFARIASAMTLVGAPFDLVAAAARIPSDEIRHADFAIRTASTLAGTDASIDFDVAAAKKAWEKPMDLEQLDRLMLEVSAIGETLSCALFQACLERAEEPMMRALFSGILSDEVHHARLGWYYFTWRAPQWTKAEQQRISDRCGHVLLKVEKQFWTGRDAPPKAKKAARALGVLESDGQRKAVRKVMEDEIVPGLDALGLGASHAWRIRERGAG
jgi:hypothetical protein